MNKYVHIPLETYEKILEYLEYGIDLGEKGDEGTDMCRMIKHELKKEEHNEA